MALQENQYVKQRPDVDGLTKRRFFYRQASDIYGGAAGFFSYGPPGCAMKNNFFSLWRQHFVVEEDLMEIEDTCIMQVFFFLPLNWFVHDVFLVLVLLHD